MFSNFTFDLQNLTAAAFSTFVRFATGTSKSLLHSFSFSKSRHQLDGLIRNLQSSKKEK